MANAQRAYQYYSRPQVVTAQPSPRGMRVERTGERTSKQSSILVTAAAMGAILLLVVAALMFGRIALTTATVTTLIESDSLSGEISTARSSGISLEMEQSVLSNTYAIDAAGKRLGMSAPAEVGVIALSPDIVAVNGSGDLSLSSTVKNLVGTQG